MAISDGDVSGKEVSGKEMGLALRYAPAHSTNVQVAYYFPKTRQSLVVFHNGDQYLHSKVPIEAWENWTKYHSAGQFYHSIIKRYPGRKLQRRNKQSI
jgi:hypothetical protein